MERKIGEIFEDNGDWYQCVKGETCYGCSLYDENGECHHNDIFGGCGRYERNDKKSVNFKKLEKVGKPYMRFDCSQGYNIMVQNYRLQSDCWCRSNGLSIQTRVFPPSEGTDIISIEIKQNKEDMVEKKQKLDKLVDDYMACRIQYTEFDKEIKALYDKEDSEPTPKEFDLEAAKQGKLVCTRDGRKARIIAFDRRLFYKNVSYPILALVERSDGEDDVYGYNEKGKVLIEDDAEYKDDLKMLPEKHEGWVNVYKMKDGEIIIGQYPYESQDYCRNLARSEDGYIDTIKIEWYE